MNRSSLLLSLALLVACGEAVPKKSGGTVAPRGPQRAAEVAAPVADPYYYNPAGKRDPFQSFIQASQRGSDEISEDAPPLQRWDVEKFSLTGTITDAASPAALLVDPEGLGHVVRVGTYVGRNWGKVTRISGGGVTVTEEYQTIEGELVVNPVEIAFATNEKKR